MLERLAAKLRGPQPKPKRVRPRRFVAGVPFALGDVVRLRNPENDAEALVIVVDQAPSYGSPVPDPVIEVLLWEGGHVPPPEALATMPVLLEVGPEQKPRTFMTAVSTYTKDDVFGPQFGEVVARGIRRRASRDWQDVPYGWESWQSLASLIGGRGYRELIEITRVALGRREP